MLKRTPLLLPALAFAGLLLAGCGGISGGSLKIVSDLPMTGPAKAQTQSIVNAITLAFAEKNYKICDGRWTLQYDSKDDASEQRQGWDEALVRANANYYLNDPSIVAVIGPYDSEAAKIMIPILNRDNLLLISPANTYSGLTQAGASTAEGEPDVYYPNGNRNYIQLGPTADTQGKAAANWAKILGVKSAYLLDDLADGRSIADSFEQTANGLGLTVMGREGIDKNATQFTAVAGKIVTRFNPDLIYFGGSAHTGGSYLVRDLRAAGYSGIIMASDGLYDPALLTVAGAAAERTYLTFDSLPPAAMTDKAAEWLQHYKSTYGADPEPQAVYGYLAAQVLLNAFERVCAVGGAPTDRKALRESAFATQDFTSILGPFSITATGDTTLTTLSGIQVHNGKFEFVSVLGGG